MQEELNNLSVCLHCNQAIKPATRFCNFCGASQVAEKQSHKKDLLTALIIFYCIEFAVCATITFKEDLHGLKTLLIADAIMAASAIAFSLTIVRDLAPIFKWNNFSIKKTLIYLSIAIVGSMFVNYSMSWLNLTLFKTNEYYYFTFSSYKYPLLLMTLVTAAVPAIFEELGYRGFILEGLLKMVDKRQAMFISAFVFAIIHLSIFSIVWILPFGLLLAYIRIKENTIWYGVFFHFTFNFVNCLFEYYHFNPIF